MTITVKDSNGAQVATGTLLVDTSGPNATATFQPANGTVTNCTGVSWNNTPSGAVAFTFPVSGSANGAFPLGPAGANFNYVFTGQNNANGSSPGGKVTWPPTGPAETEDSWQASG